MSSDPTSSDDDLVARELAEANPPEGFKHLVRGGPYFLHLGPLFARRNERDIVVIGLRVSAKHTNMLGITHGGMLVTFADGAMGINVSMSRQQSMVSVHLSSDFLDSARPGDWLEAHTRIDKEGTRLSFASSELRVGGKVLLRCTGVFATVGRPGQPLPRDNDG